jgi:hypothetical protein
MFDSFPRWSTSRARVAGLSLSHSPDAPLLTEARRELRLARFAEEILDLVTSVLSSDLDPASVRRLTSLLNCATRILRAPDSSKPLAMEALQKMFGPGTDSLSRLENALADALGTDAFKHEDAANV